jgi:hypothetical protein
MVDAALLFIILLKLKVDAALLFIIILKLKSVVSYDVFTIILRVINSHINLRKLDKKERKI